jgi:hypothetical protein
MHKLLILGHLGNIHKKDNELVHVSPTRSREFALEFSKIGFDTTAGVYWPEAEQELSKTLRYVHIDKLNADDYDIVFCHLALSVEQLYNLAHGVQITQGAQAYGKDQKRFQAILDHPRKYLQLDAPRPVHADPKVSLDLVNGMRAVGVATRNAVVKWHNMYPQSRVEWVNAATIAYKYPRGPKSPYSTPGPNVVYLGRMNDASEITPLDKIHSIAKRMPSVNFHIITNKIRDGNTDKIFAINELQTGTGRELRYDDACRLIKLPNIFLHRGSTYEQSFDWMHWADCAIGFTVRRNQDVASCKSWEYFGTGVPAVIEEDTPETWIIDKVPTAGKIAKYGDWDDFAQKIRSILDNPKRYKRRKIRHHIASYHGYDSRTDQWARIMEKYV